MVITEGTIRTQEFGFHCEPTGNLHHCVELHNCGLYAGCIHSRLGGTAYLIYVPSGFLLVKRQWFDALEFACY